MLLPSQHKELTESYLKMTLGEFDDISDVMIEEIVEELVEECLEFGYELDDVLEAVENASYDYFETLDEATVTYGSDTESPQQRKARAQERLGSRKSAARKSAIQGAVNRVKAKVGGAKAAAEIAGSIAKDEARRAGRAAVHGAQKAGAAVSAAAQQKKAQVKSGVKRMLGAGLRAVAGGAGRVAQASRKVGSAASKAADRLGEQTDIFDLVIEYLCTEGYADTNEAAISIMANMSEEWRKSIIESKGDGNLANNYPPYDKVTRGDIIAGALGQDQMGGKNKTKKSKKS